MCGISKPSVTKGNQKCFYLLHNTDVLIRALISSEGKLKSDDLYKTHTLPSLSPPLSSSHSLTHRQSIIRWTVAAEIKKKPSRNSVKIHIQEIRWHSFVRKLPGCVQSAITALSFAQWLSQHAEEEQSRLALSFFSSLSCHLIK